MAKELNLKISGSIAGTYKKTGNSTIAGATVAVNNQEFNETLIDGLGDAINIVNLLYSKRHAISSGAGVTLDLTSLTDEFGDSISLPSKKLIFIKNQAAVGSSQVLICTSLFASGVNMNPQEWRMICCPSGLSTVPSSLAFTTASGTSFNFDILVAGIND
ncbi:MAG: hypothetical protein IPM51_11915 [Sphingobacteriaceae bacterium]|nr:hypothetical protein [Sphingobacteriaceae bacterium]